MEIAILSDISRVIIIVDEFNFCRSYIKPVVNFIVEKLKNCKKKKKIKQIEIVLESLYYDPLKVT